MEAQKHLFDIIKTYIPDQHRLAGMMEDLLGLGRDSVYRRIRGETELSFSELQKLCSHFNLSLDEILNFQSEQGALFQYTSVNMADQSSYINYIERLSKTLTLLQTAEDKELLFTAQDVPFYHFLNHTELMFFKLYVWYDVINPNKVSFHEFCDRLDKTTILPIYERMFCAYRQIPSKEIWTTQTLDTILRLLEYYMETGAFDGRETVLSLLSQLSGLLDTIQGYTKTGYKDAKTQTPFSLYVCSVDLENNFMLTRRGDLRICTIKL
ncbi:MAG: helix-turn-helix domain-containing protein, partial [Prevotellaceae bacterium]|nr:helix-turn-helix domain-containing protein [Prevotellaceae bacterium]